MFPINPKFISISALFWEIFSEFVELADCKFEIAGRISHKSSDLALQPKTKVTYHKYFKQNAYALAHKMCLHVLYIILAQKSAL